MTPVDIDEEVRIIKRVGFEPWLILKLVKAFKEARKGKLKTYDEHKFELKWAENLLRLERSIVEGYYEPGASVAFVIFEPMVREIFAAPFIDRVVHHFLSEMQAGWWDRRLIYDSYSCRKGKGTLFGIKRAQTMMRQVSRNGERKAYVIQLDISGYFMSLPRNKLYERVRWGLDKQFEKYKDDTAAYRLYRTCDFLWQKVIFDDPVKKAWKRGLRENWNPDVLPLRKSLFAQPPGQGLVIGNFTSQLSSNIYLDKLDRFVKNELEYKYYGRYVDDFFIMVPEEEYERAKRDIVRIERYLKEELLLTVHPTKRYLQPVSRGMHFLGARIYPHQIYLSDRLQAKFNRAAEEFCCGYKDLDSITSYLGLLKHYDANKFMRQLSQRLGWDLK
ncbi:hypothetical protein IJF93_02430 [Candidatus Saccharibacteria bacterium]|nr:hypothetical protein [Candidatus Saccharibacteria bacterium]